MSTIAVTAAIEQYLLRSIEEGYIVDEIVATVLADYPPDVEYDYETDFVCYYLAGDGTYTSETVNVAEKTDYNVEDRIVIVDSTLAAATSKTQYKVTSKSTSTADDGDGTFTVTITYELY